MIDSIGIHKTGRSDYIISLEERLMIAGMTYYEMAGYFLVYSFLGWCLEVVYQAVKRGKVINRGFLCGPVCPVYGFGVLAVFILTKSPLAERLGITGASLARGNDLVGILILYVFGVLLATTVELLAGWLLDVLFHARWWDYSKEPFNFHGYICLRFSLIWGAAILFVVLILQPVIEMDSRLEIPPSVGWVILAVCYAILALDLLVTVMIVAGFNKKLSELDKLQQELRRASYGLSQKLGNDTLKVEKNVSKVKDQAELKSRDLQTRINEKKQELMNSDAFFGPKRLLKAFPDIRHRDYQAALNTLRAKAFPRRPGSKDKKEMEDQD